jgi:cytochrome c-type biogenesis protein CcmF
MENVGALAILLAFCFAIYAIAASLVGKLAKRPLLVLSAERAVYCIWVLVSTAVGLVLYALFTSDFRLVHVYSNSNLAMSSLYKVTALWGGMEGSLLLWSWLLATYSAIVVIQNRRKFRNMMPYVTAIITTVQAFFLSLNAFVESPFKVWWAGRGIVADISDGQGLNPLLQYWTMVIHPPMLYLGFIGFVVPFAFAMASLITKQPGEEWIHTTRRWTLVTWLFQSTGVLLGMNWAYSILGWGGYWEWDPVENASLLPWITATAFLHSVMMQEKKGMMKVWNMVLVSITFWLPIFGTTLTRTGMAQSVHAFGESPLGPYFYVFLAVGIAATVSLILSRLDYLKSEAQLESVVSRESSFMFNNLVLLASCFAILWGTLFPVITEAISEKQSVGPEFFNRINIPIALFLLLLTGVGPLIAWRRSSIESLKRAFMWPAIAGVAVGVGLVLAGMRQFYPLISFMLCTFVLVTVGIEFFKGALAIATKSGTNLLMSMVELTHRNTRRYGGYIVHIGIVIIFAGITGSAFKVEQKGKGLGLGESTQVGPYTLKADALTAGSNTNYRWWRLDLGVSKNGQSLGEMHPEQRFYMVSKQTDTEVSIRHRLNEDLYVNFRVDEEDEHRVVLSSYVNPLTTWVWMGYFVILFGTLICLTPTKTRMVWPRMEVVGIAGKHAKVED